MGLIKLPKNYKIFYIFPILFIIKLYIANKYYLDHLTFKNQNHWNVVPVTSTFAFKREFRWFWYFYVAMSIVLYESKLLYYFKALFRGQKYKDMVCNRANREKDLERDRLRLSQKEQFLKQKDEKNCENGTSRTSSSGYDQSAESTPKIPIIFKKTTHSLLIQDLKIPFYRNPKYWVVIILYSIYTSVISLCVIVYGMQGAYPANNSKIPDYLWTIHFTALAIFLLGHGMYIIAYLILLNLSGNPKFQKQHHYKYKKLIGAYYFLSFLAMLASTIKCNLYQEGSVQYSFWHDAAVICEYNQLMSCFLWATDIWAGFKNVQLKFELIDEN